MAAPTQPNQPNNPGGKPLNQAEARLYEQVKNSLRDINVATEQGRSKFRELVSVTDEWRKSLNDIAEDLENLDDNFTLINKNIREIGANIGKELTKELENAGDEADIIRKRIGDVKKLVNEAGNATRKAADLTQDFADGTARTSDIGKQIAKNNKTITQLLHEANDARERGNEGLATQLQKLIAEEEISQRTLETLKGQAEQIDKASGLTGKLLDGFKKIPLIGEVIGEELADINKELREEGALALKNGTKFNMMGAAAGKVGGLLKEKLKDPLVLMGFAVAGIVKTFTFLKDIAFGFSKNIAETGRNMGLTRDSAKGMVEYTQYVSDHAHDIGVNLKTAGEAMGELNDAFGTSIAMSTQLVEGQVELKEKMGLSAEEAANISKFSVLTGKSQDDIVFGITKQNKGILNNKKVLQEVAKTEGQLAAFYKNDPILIGKAVVQAQKLGMSLQQTKQISDGLLDIESSLANEFEAEVLLGKDINLNQARQLALMGDTAGAAQAMLDNIGGINEFQNLNRIQQDALAKSMNMSSDELAKTLTQQAQLGKLGEAQRARVKELRAAGKDELADKIEAAAGDEKAVRMAEMQVDAQEKIAQAGEKFREAIARLVQGPLGTMIDGFATVVGSLATGVGYISKFMSFLGDIPVLGTALKGLGTVAAVILGFKGIAGLFKYIMKGTAINPMVVTLSPADRMAMGGGGGGGLDLAGSGGGGKPGSKFAQGRKFAKLGKFGRVLAGGSKLLGKAGSMLGLTSMMSGMGGGGAPAGGSAPTVSGGDLGKVTAPSASAVEGSTAKTATKGGKGFFGRMFSKIKDIGGALLNPTKTIGGWLKGNIGGFLKKLVKFPVISSLIEGIFAYGDIKEMIASGKKGPELNQMVGKRTMQALGGVLGSIGGAALGSFIPIPGVGTFLGGLAGDFVGRWLGGVIADAVGAETIGGAVVGMMGDDGKVKAMAEGGIVTGPTRALVGEAGSEAVIPLKEFYAKIDELISAVKQGSNIYLDSAVVSTKLQTPMAIATRRTG
jgi:hypothetical protein